MGTKQSKSRGVSKPKTLEAGEVFNVTDSSNDAAVMAESKGVYTNLRLLRPISGLIAELRRKPKQSYTREDRTTWVLSQKLAHSFGLTVTHKVTQQLAVIQELYRSIIDASLGLEETFYVAAKPNNHIPAPSMDKFPELNELMTRVSAIRTLVSPYVNTDLASIEVEILTAAATAAKKEKTRSAMEAAVRTALDRERIVGASEEQLSAARAQAIQKLKTEERAELWEEAEPEETSGNEPLTYYFNDVNSFLNIANYKRARQFTFKVPAFKKYPLQFWMGLLRQLAKKAGGNTWKTIGTLTVAPSVEQTLTELRDYEEKVIAECKKVTADALNSYTKTYNQQTHFEFPDFESVVKKVQKYLFEFLQYVYKTFHPDETDRTMQSRQYKVQRLMWLFHSKKIDLKWLTYSDLNAVTVLLANRDSTVLQMTVRTQEEYEHMFTVARLPRLIDVLVKSDVTRPVARGSVDPRQDITALINQLITTISVNPLVYRSAHLNFILNGPAGSGKTYTAGLIASVMKFCGLLISTAEIDIVSRPDLVGRYLGTTGPRTKSRLVANVENVLFIDEAYSLARRTNPAERDPAKVEWDPYGYEAITEIVNYLDKHKGTICVIAAGYTKQMEDFTAINEGMSRRFPWKIRLMNFTSEQFADLFKTFVGRTLRADDPEGELNSRPDQIVPEPTIKYVASVIQENPQLFKNGAGDIENLAAVAVNTLILQRIAKSQPTAALTIKDIRLAVRKYCKDIKEKLCERQGDGGLNSRAQAVVEDTAAAAADEEAAAADEAAAANEAAEDEAAAAREVARAGAAAARAGAGGAARARAGGAARARAGGAARARAGGAAAAERAAAVAAERAAAVAVAVADEARNKRKRQRGPPQVSVVSVSEDNESNG